MIGALLGQVAAIGAHRALIDVGGVGYVVEMGDRALGRLTLGETRRLWIETQVREDSLRLFGFTADEERAWFVLLLDIPGVGAKVAMALVDGLGAASLAQAIALEDKTAISRAQGVGPKLAARIAQELKGKAPSDYWRVARVAGPAAAGQGDLTAAMPPQIEAKTTFPDDGGDDGARRDAISALVNLGYPIADAARAVAEAMRASAPSGAAAAEIIRSALRLLAPNADLR